jgi:hypothetical protein
MLCGKHANNERLSQHPHRYWMGDCNFPILTGWATERGSKRDQTNHSSHSQTGGHLSIRHNTVLAVEFLGN